MNKYFSVDIYEEYGPQVKIHNTLDDAQCACFDDANDLYKWACEEECMDQYEERLKNAVYGVVLGQCESATREPTDEEKENPWYGEGMYIIEPPRLVEHSGWISVKDRLPPLIPNHPFDRSANCLLYGEQDYGDEYGMFVGYAVRGSVFYGDKGRCELVTHWQPLPQPPVID